MCYVCFVVSEKETWDVPMCYDKYDLSDETGCESKLMLCVYVSVYSWAAK